MMCDNQGIRVEWNKILGIKKDPFFRSAFSKNIIFECRTFFLSLLKNLYIASVSRIIDTNNSIDLTGSKL